MSWAVRRMDEVAELSLGKMLDEKKNKGEPLPYLANLNVRWGEFDLKDLRTMRFEGHEFERFSIRAGDIIMCEGGEPGRCALWKEEQSLMIQKALHRIRPKPAINSTFLYYSLLNIGKSILCEFDQFVAENFWQIRNLMDQNASLEKARDLLLPRLMNGELTP